MRVFLQFIRDITIFNDPKRLIIPNHVNLMYLAKSFKFKGKKHYNVGDYLSKVVFDFLLEYKGIESYKCKNTVRISFIGSVIQFLGSKTVVYGSGFLFRWAAPRFAEKKVVLDIRAVRGPLTKQLLEELGYSVPNVFGDPAILLPMFYKPTKKNVLNKYIVIPHVSKIEEYSNCSYICLSTLTTDWKKFIDTICSSEIVISSSLHGIIIAEAYGVPAIFLDDTENNDQLKYEDYYISTGRPNFKKVQSIEEAFNVEPESIPNFEEMRKGLLDAFPVDLFE